MSLVFILDATFLQTTYPDAHIPNVVTAVLASYRGVDTFGEVVVVFSAGLGVLLLLGLNGNAGFWRAKPNGVQLYPKAAPSARVSASRQPEIGDGRGEIPIDESVVEADT